MLRNKFIENKNGFYYYSNPMKIERLTPTTFALVALLHLGLVSLLWQTSKPEQLTAEQIEFVDLGDLGGGDGTPAQPAAAVQSPPPPEQSQPKPKEKLIAPKSVLKPVITHKEAADLNQQDKYQEKVQEKPERVEKPKAVEKAKPIEKTQPVEEHKVVEKSKQVAAKVSTERGNESEHTGGQQSDRPGRGSGRGEGHGSGSGNANGGSGSGVGGGSGPGSSASNAVEATGSIPRPPYPAMSLENSEEGTVVLKVLVSPEGGIVKVNVAKSSGHHRLDSAAVKAAHSGHFRAKGWTEYTVPVAFKIE